MLNPRNTGVFSQRSPTSVTVERPLLISSCSQRSPTPVTVEGPLDISSALSTKPSPAHPFSRGVHVSLRGCFSRAHVPQANAHIGLPAFLRQLSPADDGAREKKRRRKGATCVFIQRSPSNHNHTIQHFHIKQSLTSYTCTHTYENTENI